MATAIIKLNTLTNSIWATAQDYHFILFACPNSFLYAGFKLFFFPN